jgi:hypothetical protein
MALIIIWVLLYVFTVLGGLMCCCTRSPVDGEADEESAMEGNGEGYGSMRREDEEAALRRHEDGYDGSSESSEK